MKVVRRQQPEEKGFSASDWGWIVVVVVALAVVSLGLGWLATRVGAVPRKAQPAEVAVVPPSAPAAASTPPPSIWSMQLSHPVGLEEHTLSHYEAVRATVEGLREHSHRDPHAPDALTEAQIKTIEARGAVIE